MSQFWSKIKRGLFMTHDEMWHRLSTAVASSSPGEIVETLEEVLIGADLGVELTAEILKGLESKNLPWDELRDEVARRILAILNSTGCDDMGKARPGIVLLVGVNGSGKTTTAAKLARREKEEGNLPLLVAADTFRAGAIDQLKVWASRLDVPIMAHNPGGDPAAVVFDAVASAEAKGVDTVFIDTAGRLHTKAPLMAELQKIVRVVHKANPEVPREILLVLDATTGQNGLAQASEFLQAVDVSGIVLTKLDGTARGGIVVHIVHSLGLPVRYVGVGEGYDDLIPFDSEEFVRALLSGE